MRKAILLIVLLPLVAFSQEQASENVWQPLEYFLGTWVGESTGKSGEGKGERTYEFVMNGVYMFGKNTMTFAPQQQNPKGETHEDWAVFSYDKGRKVHVLRQFNIEGFVNQFIVDSLSTDYKFIRFVTESSENAPPGLQARLIYELKDEDHFIEIFELGFPGRDFSCWMTNTWSRKGR